MDAEELAASTATLLVAGDQGKASAHAVAAQFPEEEQRKIVLSLLPESWRDDSAEAMLGRLSQEQRALLLAWLTCQWWDGYRTGKAANQAGEDLEGVGGAAPV